MPVSANYVRDTYLNFFGKKGHRIVDSSSLVPLNDPTLMFTNAGMVQFKNTFIGAEKRDYTRATTSQKCVRAGGKHNDLENVGFTKRHQTFFEMLGNFSFGDYFKDEAIAFAWEMVTKEFSIDPSRLLVTVHASDEESADIWKKVSGFDDSKIIRINTNDNFWSMGDTGPCGPCTEIFFDHGDEHWGGQPGTAEEDGDRFIEIWNVVFMQYEKLVNGDQVNLAKTGVDTGMGLERITALLNGSNDNYDIDLLRNIMENLASIVGVDPDGEHNTSLRIIADHVRSTGFLISDSVLPSNEGRGYVLRRIMRRAMRHANLMGLNEPVMYKLMDNFISDHSLAYPALARASDLIKESVRLEENRFAKTLGRGLKLLDDEILNLGGKSQLSGEVAFKLYDTYGFPLDLTQDALKGKNISVDESGFNNAMAEQKKRARANWAGSGDSGVDTMWFSIADKIEPTEFLGYSDEVAEAQITAIVKIQDDKLEEVSELATNDHGYIVLNQTPFYGESGGQAGDSGFIELESGGIFEVLDTKKFVGKLFAHRGKLVKGGMIKGENVSARIDSHVRANSKAHHSATHLLHKALQEHLGKHVTQKGSMVTSERLRFDISHQKGLSSEDIVIIEQLVNEQIRKNTPVTTLLMTPDEAIEQGAMALFGEKYGDEVRVVSMGSASGQAGNKAFSVELCGGTHVSRTGDIGLFKIVEEMAIASGVRRIEAVCGKSALDYVLAKINVLSQVESIFKVKDEIVLERIESMRTQNRELERDLKNTKQKLAMGGEIKQENINGVPFVGKVLEGVSGKDIGTIAEELKAKFGDSIIAVAGVDQGKVALAVIVADSLMDKYNANPLVNAGAIKVGGKGGGKPNFARAGGTGSTEQAQQAIEAIKQVL